MIISIFSFICFTVLYLSLIISASSKRKLQSQPATLAMIIYSLLLITSVINFAGFMYFQYTIEHGGGVDGFIAIWSPIRTALHLGILAGLIFCVYGWRKPSQSEAESSYAQPTKFLVIALVLFFGVMFGSALVARFIVDRFHANPMSMLNIWKIITIGAEIASIILVNTAIFGWRDAYMEPEVATVPSPADTNLEEDEGEGELVDGSKQHMFVLTNVKSLKSPNICPHCSKLATEQTMLKHYEYDQPNFGLLLYMGLLGQLVVFLITGFDGKDLFKAKVCNACSGMSQLFRVMEWFVRLGSIVLVFVLMTEFSSKSQPLFKREWGVQLMVFSPLLVGWFGGLICHNLAVKFKGVTSHGLSPRGKRICQVKSTKWYEAFLTLNPGTVKSSWKQ